jgi:hypothetical protein
MKGKPYGNMREAIHATATANGSMKTLAAELDWSPSEFSRRTTLGDDNSLSFPADDRLIKIQQLTGDHSILATMADALGYELHPRQERMPELVQELTAEAKRLTDSIQMVLSTPWITQSKGGKR